MILFVVELPSILLFKSFESLKDAPCSELFDSLFSIDASDDFLFLSTGSDNDADFDVVVDAFTVIIAVFLSSML